ncbi:unnamed protein product [Bursaphelenchus okinawaensis]|uniref:Elongation of very long chain fatty acids protein n=1 Tax=Bursaphelenchus okinawaensis TaxID=465554 RepID=A0A811KXK2_9BILA|nr:unnamed protein product [Bursaphelenchus okinawaensis]CAG9113464.1 unnamed protein product [Bursaphelenchus okinawaensis]
MPLLRSERWASEAWYSGPEYDVNAAYDDLYSYRPLILFTDLVYVLFVWKIAPRARGIKLDPKLLKDVSIVWNCFNAITSIYMFVLLVPELKMALGNGWYYTTCRVGTFYTGQSSGHAMYLFCLSKLWELGDTVLLVARGRKLMFLHYFHHSVVVIQVMFTYYGAGSMARLGTDMNAFVHSLMYSYFALVNVFPQIRKYAPIITVLQLSQFVVACVGMLSLCGYVLSGYDCETSKTILPIHFFIYVMFFLLFMKFFMDNYVNNKDGRKNGTRKVE